MSQYSPPLQLDTASVASSPLSQASSRRSRPSSHKSIHSSRPVSGRPPRPVSGRSVHSTARTSRPVSGRQMSGRRSRPMSGVSHVSAVSRLSEYYEDSVNDFDSVLDMDLNEVQLQIEQDAVGAFDEDRIGVSAYIAKCKELDLAPKQSIIKKCRLDPSEINLQHTYIGAHHSECVAQIINHNQHLTTLNLSGCAIGAGLQHIIAPLLRKDGPEVREIVLARNALGSVRQLVGDGIPVGWRPPVPEPAEDEEDAKGKGDDEEEVVEVDPVFESLNALHLLPDIGPTRLLNALVTSSRSILKLDLSKNTLGDRFAASFFTTLVQNRTIHTLNLSGNALSDTSIRVLAKHLPNLNISSLDISHNHVGELGAGLLSASMGDAGLERLILTRNRLGDVGCAFILSAFCNAWASPLLLARAQDLGIGVPRVPQAKCRLTELSLSGCGGDLLTVLQFCQMLKDSAGLRVIDVHNNLLADRDGMEAIVRTLVKRKEGGGERFQSLMLPARASRASVRVLEELKEEGFVEDYELI